jgi:hypothetical protein
MPRPTTRTTDLLPGELRLLHDLAAVQALVDGGTAPARVRLERQLGAELTELLCSSLVQATPAKAA